MGFQSTITAVAALFLACLAAASVAVAQAPPGVTLSSPPFTSNLMCTVPSGFPLNTCQVSTFLGVAFSSTVNSVFSVRYQSRTPVQFWIRNTRYVASFSTSFTVNIIQGSSFIGGGGIAFAITPSMSVFGTNDGSLGLFVIDPRTGASLAGANSKTVAVEIDLARNAGGWDAPVPHLGLNINSAKSVVTNTLGPHNLLVNRKLGVWVDYNARLGTLQVRTHKVSVLQTPSKLSSTLAISVTGLDLASAVREFSYVGFSTRVPLATNGRYRLYDWKFSTTWVLGTVLH